MTPIDHVIETLGVNIRDLREAKGLGVNELAERAGISRQTLGLIERAEANPSIAIIARLAAALGVTISRLVDAESAQDGIVLAPESFKILWRDHLGSSGQLVLTSRRPQPVELWQWDLAAGARYDATAECSEEALLLLAGTATVTFGDQTRDVPESHAIRLPFQQPYSIINHSQKQARFILLYVAVGD